MKQFYLIDERTNGMEDVFIEKLNASTKEDAVREAARAWYHMTPADQKRRTDFYIGKFDTDEEGYIDFNSIENYVPVIDIIEVADRIKESGTWNDEDCRTLCTFAGMVQEWDDAEAEDFEQVMYQAADRLGVEII